MKRRGKVIACSVAALGAVVLVAAGIACKKRILEEWYLWRLKSGTTTPSREIALEALAALRSSKAIPEMAQIIESDPNLAPAAVRALLRMPKEAGPVLLTKLNAKDRASRCSLLDGIRKVKREDMAVDTAVPVLTELALHDPDG